MDSVYYPQPEEPKTYRNDALTILGILFGLIITLIVTIITVPSFAGILSIAVLIISLAIPGVIYYSPAGKVIKRKRKTIRQNSVANKNKDNLSKFLSRFQKLSLDNSPIITALSYIIELQKTNGTFDWIPPNHYWIEQSIEELTIYVTDAKSFCSLTNMLLGVIKDNTERIIDTVTRLNAIKDLKPRKDYLVKFRDARTNYNKFIEEYQDFRDDLNKQFEIKDFNDKPQVITSHIPIIPDILPD